MFLQIAYRILCQKATRNMDCGSIHSIFMEASLGFKPVQLNGLKSKISSHKLGVKLLKFCPFRCQDSTYLVRDDSAPFCLYGKCTFSLAQWTSALAAMRVASGQGVLWPLAHHFGIAALCEHLQAVAENAPCLALMIFHWQQRHLPIWTWVSAESHDVAQN